MRVVIAPFNRMNDRTLTDVREAGHEVRCTGQDWLSYPAIAAQYPRGWHPDVFIFWSPEYNPVPRGLDCAPCFKVGVVGDWNLGGQAVQQIGGAFDLLFADANGADRLRNLGFPRVESTPLWSFDPDLHRRLPELDRDIDILLIGNFNHEVQRDRAWWLGRVARLSARYKVCLTSGIHGEDYTHLMNRAKIVFNRSIRGEINMRCYEASACGALLFYERENTEIRTLYTDRQECVLYGEDDLEQLLDYYLANDREREAISEAAARRVQTETPSLHVLAMFECIERRRSAVAGGHGVSLNLAFTSLSSPEKELRLARQWLLTADLNAHNAAESALRRAEQSGAAPAVIARLRGYYHAQIGQYRSGPDRDSAWSAALIHLRASIELEPDSVAGRLNLASLLSETGSHTDAEQQVLAAYDLLSRPGAAPGPPSELYWPCRFSAFGVEYDKVEMAHQHGSSQWSEAMLRLLRWRTSDLLCRFASSNGRFLEAERFGTAACELIPDISSTQFQLARALNSLGCLNEAEFRYRAALDLDPFLIEAHVGLAQLLLDRDRPEDALTVLNDWAAIIAGCPPYESALDECDRLRSIARQECSRVRGSDVQRLRLLAFPSWESTAQWQNLIHAFVRRPESAPALLMLWADPAAGEPEYLMRRVASYLTADLNLEPPAFPDITIVSQSFAPQDRWKLLHAADAIIDAGPIAGEFRDVMAASGLRALSIDEMHRLAA